MTEITTGSRVHVHYNLHKGGYSVLSLETHRVIAHVDNIRLANVVFRVQPAGLRRIRERKCRLVCAYVLGNVVDFNTCPATDGMRRVTFNPYRADTFTCDAEPIYSAELVQFSDRAGWIA